jgi:hypothetical protein
MANKLGWNAGFNFFYLTGGNDEGTDGFFLSPGLTANLAIRPYGTAETNNMILLFGIHYSYGHASLDFESGDTAEVNLWMYGPMAGVKAQLHLSKTVKLVPFYVFKYNLVNIDAYYNGEYREVPEDDFASHIIGFDLVFGTISIGTMLDTFSGAGNDVIMIHLTFKF